MLFVFFAVVGSNPESNAADTFERRNEIEKSKPSGPAVIAQQLIYLYVCMCIGITGLCYGLRGAEMMTVVMTRRRRDEC